MSDTFADLDEPFDVWLAGFVRQTFGGEGPQEGVAAKPSGGMSGSVASSAEPFVGAEPSSPPVDLACYRKEQP